MSIRTSPIWKSESPLSRKLTELRSRLSQADAKHRATSLALEAATASLQGKRAEYEALLKVKEIVQTISLDCQQQCQRRIAHVVTRCLEAVFGESSMRFALLFEQKRGQTEVRGVLLDPEGHELDPMNSCGGGVLDVAAFGLRLACMMLSRPRPSKVLVLDEPFCALSKNYQPKAAALLSELSLEFGLQIIMITHIETLTQAADALVDISK